MKINLENENKFCMVAFYSYHQNLKCENLKCKSILGFINFTKINNCKSILGLI